VIDKGGWPLLDSFLGLFLPFFVVAGRVFVGIVIPRGLTAMIVLRGLSIATGIPTESPIVFVVITIILIGIVSTLGGTVLAVTIAIMVLVISIGRRTMIVILSSSIVSSPSILVVGMISGMLLFLSTKFVILVVIVASLLRRTTVSIISPVASTSTTTTMNPIVAISIPVAFQYPPAAFFVGKSWDACVLFFDNNIHI